MVEILIVIFHDISGFCLVGGDRVIRSGGRVGSFVLIDLIRQFDIALAVIAVHVVLDLILGRDIDLDRTAAPDVVELSANDRIEPVQPVAQSVFRTALFGIDSIDHILLGRFCLREVIAGHVFVQGLGRDTVGDELDVQVSRVIVVVSEVERSTLCRFRC